MADDNMFGDLIPQDARSDDFSDLRPGERPEPTHVALQDNMFHDLVPKDDTASPSEVAKAFTGPANETILAPVRWGMEGANKLLTATGMQAADNPEPEAKLKEMFYPDVKNTRGTRIANAAGTYIPDTAAMLMTAGGAAPEILAKESTNPLMGALKDTVKSYADSPGLALRDVAVAAPLAGAGAQVGKEAAKDTPYEGAAELAGGVLAPAMGAAGTGAYYKYLSPSMWGLRGAKFIGRPLISNFAPASWMEGDGLPARALRGIKDSYTNEVNTKAMPMAADQLRQAGPDAMAQLADAQRLKQTIPGFNPTLAESTGTPSFVANQKGGEARSSGSVLDNFVRRKQDSENAIDNFVDNAAPVASDGQIADAAQRRLEAVGKPIDKQLSQVGAQQAALPDKLPEASDNVVGGQMRDRLENMRADKQKEMSQLADDLGLNGATGVRVSPDALRSAVTDALPSKFATGISPTMKKISGIKPGTPLTFGDAKYFMEQLGSEARAAAKAGDMNSARIISDARGGIDDYLTDTWAPASGLGDKYAQFRNTYKTEYIDRFNTGNTRDVKSIGPDNNYRTDNEDVAGSYFQPGNVTAAQDFHNTFRGDPQAMQAMQAHILDSARDASVKDGQLDPAKLAKWVDKNKDNLAQFPDVAKQVQDVHGLATDLAERQATLETRKQAVADTSLAKTMGDNDATLDTMLQNPNVMKRTVAVMTDPEKQSLARQMWQKASANGAEDPAAMKQFMADNDDALKQVLTPEHIQSLNDIQQAWEMNARVPTPTGVAGEPILDKFKQAVGSTPQQLLSRAFALKSGRTGLKYTIGDLAARAGLNANQQQAKAMMDRAMYDSDFAKELSDVVRTDKPKPEKLNRIKAYMFNTGMSAMGDQMGDQ